MLIEIHTLQNHAASNLNRDDTGSPKECTFGGYKRARISSQCLKRSIRTSAIFEEAVADHLGTRTRRLPEIVRGLLNDAGIAPEYSEIAAKKVSGFGTKDGKERPPDDGKYNTAQTMFLAPRDWEAVYQTVLAAIQKSQSPKDFDAVKSSDLQSSSELSGYRPITVDIALFGRMITSSAFKDVEGSTQVAHAFSTHKIEHEFDYFTAVDDLQGGSEDEEAGADMIGDVEFNSACYYKYFSIDYNGLVDNLIGQPGSKSEVKAADASNAKAIAKSAIVAFLKAAILTTPTGKQNSFAAHQLPSLVLVEIRPNASPVSYANAFVSPVRQSAEDDLVKASLKKLKEHVKALTDGFNLTAKARLSLSPTEPEFAIDGVTRCATLDALGKRLAEELADD